MENAIEELQKLIGKRVAIDTEYGYVRGILRTTSTGNPKEDPYYISVRDAVGNYAGMEFIPKNVKSIQIKVESAGYLIPIDAVIVLK